MATTKRIGRTTKTLAAEFYITPTNEGQDLNYTRQYLGPIEEAREIAMKMAIGLQNALPGAMIGYRIEDRMYRTIEVVNL